MILAIAAMCSFVLDLLLGDPAWMPHPVVGFGKLISAMEKAWNQKGQAPKNLVRRGLAMAILLPLGTLVVSGAVCWLFWRIHPVLGFLLQVFWGWQCLAMCGLGREARRVHSALTGGTLGEARKAVSRIVGRDTEHLSEEGVTKAAVETVAENFSDGEMAPLFWFLIGGAPFALCYKAINTMDSMVGYTSPRYLHFGRCPAKLDDGANWIPARLSALLLIAAAGIGWGTGRNALRIWRRDRRNHPSPNSAQTEAAMAGALEVQLAGPATYFGELHDKPTIGDPTRAIEPRDILRSIRLMYAAGLLGLLALCVLRFLCCFGLWWLFAVL